MFFTHTARVPMRYIVRSIRCRAILPAALLAVMAGCADDATDTGNSYRRVSRSVSVIAIPAQLETLTESVTAVGTARALHSATLYPETAGFVTGISFLPDVPVNAGDSLLQLDDRDERLALRLAHVVLADAERVVERYTSVNREDANIAQSQIDTAIAAVDAAGIAVEQAELALSRRQMTAPFDGRAGISDIDVGDRIDTSTLVTTLDDRQTLLINFMLPEIFIGQVVNGTPVSVQLWNSGRPAFAGEVIAVDSRIGSASRAFTVRASINNTHDRFRPGMAFEMTIDASRGEFIAVPDVAVQWGADGAYVWVAVNGKAERRDIRLIKRLPNRLLIEGDVEPGALVVAEGIQAVRNGVTLNLMDPLAIGTASAMPVSNTNKQSTDEA